nr:MAG TPA: hypothetical protein [Caudoviricetes sp.]
MFCASSLELRCKGRTIILNKQGFAHHFFL